MARGGTTAIEVALENFDAEALRALLANAGGRVIQKKALEWASWAVDLAELGADLELRDNGGWSAMDLARRAGSQECAAYIEMRLLEEAASGLAVSARAAPMRL